jgi:tetratricopeptide (TPR) repeat protein
MILLAVALAALPAQPAMSATRQTAASQPAEKASGELFETYMRQLFGKKYAEALATASKLELDPGNKEGRAIVAAMRAAALLGLERDEEARKLFAEAGHLAPNESYPSYLQFQIGLITDNIDVAAIALDRMIARMPDVVRDLDRNAVSYFLRNEPKGEERKNGDRRIAIARLGYGGQTETGDYMASNAMKILMERSDVAGARDLVRYIDEPQLVENLLIQKRYAPLWPEIEAQAGPHLQKARASAVSSAERYYQESPEDHERLQLLINALRHAGRLDEALALREKLPADSAGMASADEQMGWAVNNVSLALHEAGRAEEADQLFALLNNAPMADENWRVSMKINRLELLVADGKFTQALPLIDPTAKVEGSPYAYQLVRRLRYCTFHGLGRRQEAARLLPELMEHAKDAISPTIDALLCAGQIDEAEKLALASLADEEFQEDFVRQLQKQSLTSDDPSVWTKGWRELRQRPAIAAKFNELGRDLPSAFLPPERRTN